MRVAVVVAALGEVDNLAAVGLDQGDVLVVPSAVADVVDQQPAAVRAPLEGDVAVGVGVVEAAVECGGGLPAFEVEYAQGSAVLEEGHLFAVGAEHGLLGGLVAPVEHFLGESGIVGDVLVVLAVELDQV